MRATAKRQFLFLTLSGVLLAAGVVAGCGGGAPASNPSTGGSPTPSQSPASSPTPVLSPTPSNTPAATPTPSGTPPTGGTYVPLGVGTTWSYDETAPGTVTKTTALASEAVEDIGGEKAGITGTRLRETTTDPATGKVKVHLDWHEDRGVVVLRQREEVYGNSGALKHEIYYEPSRLILDMQPDHLVPGAVYYESYSDKNTTLATNTTVVTQHVVTWTMIGTESLTTPGGTFDCIKLHRVSQNAATGAIESDKLFWFAQNVGKVKESTLNAGDETLTAHTP